MPIEIKEVTTLNDKKQFVNLQFSIYKGNKYWVPPIKADEIKSLSKETNPAYDFCKAKFWIAFKGDKCVGRIGAIINKKYNEKTGENLGRISRVEFIDDHEISTLLFETAEKWIKKQGAIGVLGPLGFTNLDTQGLLIEGFDYIQSVASVYHLPYYQIHFQKLGYKKEIDWVEFRLKIAETPEKAVKMAALIKERYKLKQIVIKNRAQLKQYAHKVFEVLNDAFDELPFVTRFDKKMMDYYITKYFSLFNLNLIKLFETEEGKLAGFIIVVPSLSKAMQKANGKLFPFGFIHILRALKHNNEADIFLTGVDPKLQGMGVPALLITEELKTIHKMGIKEVETTGIFEDNNKAITTWKNYEHIQHKRRRCYRKMF